MDMWLSVVLEWAVAEEQQIQLSIIDEKVQDYITLRVRVLEQFQDYGENKDGSNADTGIDEGEVGPTS
ncbi:hypothetical protein NDU88_006682 [Pleurodeles waltl]|uniref:Uncharacterized protein n=1 Tax=Pleurodeles waltl TaxID=8319 RepID=A0AAV7RNQ9_PLEWA|nr:hypothetical protein NDU88_006682 [Pleurodeles waltl]